MLKGKCLMIYNQRRVPAPYTSPHSANCQFVSRAPKKFQFQPNGSVLSMASFNKTPPPATNRLCIMDNCNNCMFKSLRGLRV